MTTFKNQRELAHAWAQGRTDSGKCNGGLFYEGKTIYSYGYHFPVAHRINADTVLYNGTSYSVSTSKQQGYVRNTLSHKDLVFVSTAVIKAFSNKYMNEKETAKIVLDDTLASVDTSLKSAAKRKKLELKNSDMDHALWAVSNARRLYKILDLTFPARLEKLWHSISEDREKFLSVYADDVKKAEIAAEKKRLSKLRAQQKADAADFNLWRNGSSDYCPASYYADANDGAYLRYCPLANGNEIQTSRGASFPFDADAKKAFTMIRRIKETGQKIECATLPKYPRLGHYTIDTIHANGDVRAGCHFVQWAEIERVARELKIYP